MENDDDDEDVIEVNQPQQVTQPARLTPGGQYAQQHQQQTQQHRYNPAIPPLQQQQHQQHYTPGASHPMAVPGKKCLLLSYVHCNSLSHFFGGPLSLHSAFTLDSHAS